MPRPKKAISNIDEELVLSLVTDEYLKSRDFNGMSAELLATVMELPHEYLRGLISSLVAQDKIQINFGQNFVNIAVRAWDLGAKEQQLEHLAAKPGLNFILYPSPSHLKRAASRRFRGRPFSRALAFGRGQLEPEFFDVSVLEAYRNDPRYYYRCNSVSGSISIRDEFSDKMPESDKVLLQTFGFGFDDDMNRYVAVYLIYLSRLSAEHQQIWNAKRLDGKFTLHPDYYQSTIRGFWPEKVMIFGAFLQELHHINCIAELIGMPPLFKHDYVAAELPEFSFLIRPTLKEFQNFVHLLDKMISDNINPDFFKGELELERREQKRDGTISTTRKGTLSLLDEWLNMHGSWNPENKAIVQQVMAPLREVRNMRMRPAHAIDENTFDQAYLQEQRKLMARVYDSIQSIRQVFHSHPKAADYEIDEFLLQGKIRTY